MKCLYFITAILEHKTHLALISRLTMFSYTCQKAASTLNQYIAKSVINATVCLELRLWLHAGALPSQWQIQRSEAAR